MNRSYGISNYNYIIPHDWEAHPMNDRPHYIKSPQLKHSMNRGDFDSQMHMSRTFNRRMRMQDTFTKLLPSYNHVQNSCYIPSYTHHKHPEWPYDILGNHVSKKDMSMHHKFDEIKIYNEEMLKMPNFAPEPRKNPTFNNATWYR